VVEENGTGRTILRHVVRDIEACGSAVKVKATERPLLVVAVVPTYR
jgi:hypothetical protein